MLNRSKNYKDGRFFQATSNVLDTCLVRPPACALRRRRRRGRRRRRLCHRSCRRHADVRLLRSARPSSWCTRGGITRHRWVTGRAPASVAAAGMVARSAHALALVAMAALTCGACSDPSPPSPSRPAARRPRAPQEDPRPPRSSPLLGPDRARPAHQDHRPRGQDRGRRQEALSDRRTLAIIAAAGGLCVPVNTHITTQPRPADVPHTAPRRARAAIVRTTVRFQTLPASTSAKCLRALRVGGGCVHACCMMRDPVPS